MDFHKAVTLRIDENKELEPHRDMILYDWPEQAHLEWILVTPIPEIVDWAETVAKAAVETPDDAIPVDHTRGRGKLFKGRRG